MALTLLTPAEYRGASCGYCSTPGRRSKQASSYSYGMIVRQMSCQYYQDLIDRGWRRSGTYTYHPDMGRTCCPQFAIRLDVSQFKPARQQRSAVNRWNRFITTGLKPHEPGSAAGDGGDDAMRGGKDKGKGKGKPKGGKPFDLIAELRSCQAGYCRPDTDSASAPKRRFELVLTPAVSTPETYALYKRYQMAVHHDPESKVSNRGFRHFLCDSPLGDEVVKYAPGADTTHLPKHYGSYHLLYRVDGQLVGISVIDVLPSCVSSVYFIWDPDWAWASLGKLSALYEAALVREMRAAGAEGMDWLYMGYWIATCAKMRYKGEYAPSYLLDPGTNKWHVLTSKLDKYLVAKKRGYTPFAEVEALSVQEVDALAAAAGGENRDDVEMAAGHVRGGGDAKDGDSDGSYSDSSCGEFPSPPPPGFLDVHTLGNDFVDNLVVFHIGEAGTPQAIPYEIYRGHIMPWARVCVRELAAALGPEMLASRARGDFRTRGLLCFGDL